MKDQVSFEGIGQVTATFYAQEGVKAGQVVKPAESGAVGPCSAGDGFCGVALADGANGYAPVQVSGFAVVACADSTVTVGWVSLAADGDGGVKKAATGGREHLVVEVGTGAVTIKL